MSEMGMKFVIPISCWFCQKIIKDFFGSLNLFGKLN